MLICTFNVLGNESKSVETDEGEQLPPGYIAESSLYKDDPALPVYQWGLMKGMCTDKVAEILIKGCIDRCKVASRVPTNVEKNTVFVVDTSKLSDKDDIKCDDLGAWTCTGSKKFAYSINETGNIRKEDETDKSFEETVSVYNVQRQFYSNKSMPSLRKTIITARDAISTVPKDLAFIQYVFTGGEGEVIVKSHGNSKNPRCSAYKRTMKSTVSMIKQSLSELPARETVHKIINKRGGIMKIESSGALARDRAQVYNIAKGMKKDIAPSSIPNDDPLLQVLVKAKQEQQGRTEDILIRELPLFPEPTVFLATQQQLVDIERFCSNPEKFCVLGVDATFQIATFYFTFTTYRNLMLTTEKGNHPVFIGPGILHKQKLQTSYQTLPLLMTKYHKGTSGVLVYGTDGEENIASAFSQVFPNAQHLCCDIHMKENVKRKLAECGIMGHIASEIMYDIFGKAVSGDKVEGGLIHCTSAEVSQCFGVGHIEVDQRA